MIDYARNTNSQKPQACPEVNQNTDPMSIVATCAVKCLNQLPKYDYFAIHVISAYFISDRS